MRQHLCNTPYPYVYAYTCVCLCFRLRQSNQLSSRIIHYHPIISYWSTVAVYILLYEYYTEFIKKARTRQNINRILHIYEKCEYCCRCCIRSYIRVYTEYFVSYSYIIIWYTKYNKEKKITRYTPECMYMYSDSSKKPSSSRFFQKGAKKLVL